MKIGLYLQDLNNNACSERVFNKAMDKVKKSEADILVFPECCYTPFKNLIIYDDLFKDSGNEIPVISACLELSKRIGKAIVFSSYDEFGTICGVWCSYASSSNETRTKIYVKHTATDFSAFDFDDYKDGFGEEMFEPIVFKGKKIGLTICYDCNHSMFSRMYGVRGADIIINSTGGNVVYDKWHKFNKVRAVENHCFNFVTMGYHSDNNKNKKNSYVYGYSPEGKELPFENLTVKTKNRNEIGSVYIYDTESSDGKMEEDFSLNQEATVNKNINLYIPVGNVQSIINESRNIKRGIYSLKLPDGNNVIFCIVEGMDILKPEIVSDMLYCSELKNIENKRYIIVNKHKNIDDEIYRCQLSDVLKVRAMENFCAVILESDKYNMCYQCGNNRTAQVVMPVNNNYGIDMKRTSGPEAIWKNKGNRMRASWREGYEWLIENVKEKEGLR